MKLEKTRNIGSAAVGIALVLTIFALIIVLERPSSAGDGSDGPYQGIETNGSFIWVVNTNTGETKRCAVVGKKEVTCTGWSD